MLARTTQRRAWELSLGPSTGLRWDSSLRFSTASFVASNPLSSPSTPQASQPGASMPLDGLPAPLGHGGIIHPAGRMSQHVTVAMESASQSQSMCRSAAGVDLRRALQTDTRALKTAAGATDSRRQQGTNITCTVYIPSTGTVRAEVCFQWFRPQ